MKGKVYSADFKAKMALESIRGLKPMSELAAQFGIHPHIIGPWKKRAPAGLPEAFRSSKRPDGDAEAALWDRLYQQIDQLQVELDWLKINRLGFVKLVDS